MYFNLRTSARSVCVATENVKKYSTFRLFTIRTKYSNAFTEFPILVRVHLLNFRFRLKSAKPLGIFRRIPDEMNQSSKCRIRRRHDEAAFCYIIWLYSMQIGLVGTRGEQKV